MVRKIIEVLLMVKDQASAAVEKAQKKIDQYGTSGAKGAQRVAALEKSTNKLRDTNQKLTKTMTGGRAAFQGWAMSLMFAGMAIQKLFLSIAKSSIATFNEISKSVEGGTTGFMLLEGSVKELQFTIGAALEPVVQMLMPIIDMVIDWVSQNQELVKDLIVVGTIVGTILMVLGMATLAIVNGIIPAAQILATHFMSLGSFLGTVASALGIGILPLIGIIAVAVIALVAMWKTNFGGIREFVVTTFQNIWNVIKKIFENIKGIVMGVVKIFQGIFEGDLDKIIEGFGDVWKNVFGLVLNVVAFVVDFIINAFKFGFNMVTDLLLNLVKIVIQGLEKVATWVDNIFGTSLADKLSGLDDIIEEVKVDQRLSYGSPAQDLADKIIASFDNNVNVTVELDGEKVGESVSKNINQSLASGSEF